MSKNINPVYSRNVQCPKCGSKKIIAPVQGAVLIDLSNEKKKGRPPKKEVNPVTLDNLFIQLNPIFTCGDCNQLYTLSAEHTIDVVEAFMCEKLDVYPIVSD